MGITFHSLTALAYTVFFGPNCIFRASSLAGILLFRARLADSVFCKKKKTKKLTNFLFCIELNR